MAKNVSYSTENFIPLFTEGSKRILYIGGGDGNLIQILSDLNPELEIVGIDGVAMFSYTLKEFAERFPHFDFNNHTLEGIVGGVVMGTIQPFDCVIFNHSLHNISSYDRYNPHREEPIAFALEDACKCLVPGGKLVIRDGIFTDSGWLEKATLKNKEDVDFLKIFTLAYHAYDRIEYEICEDGMSFVMQWRYMKEFFEKLANGSDTFKSEVEKQYGILTEDAWRRIVESKDFHICHCMNSCEDYYEKLKDKVQTEGNMRSLLSDMSILICAEKG